MALNIYDPPPGWTSQAPQEHSRPPFSQVAEGIAEIDAAGPGELSAQRLRADLYWMSRQQRALEAMQARWLAELDRRDTDPLEGSAELWLEQNLGATSNAAYAQVRTARQLQDLPEVAAAWRAGQIGSQHVSVICRAMGQIEKTCLPARSTERELVRAAREMDPYSLNRHFKQLRHQADQEAAVDAEEEQRRRRWLNLWQTDEGSFRIEGELDPENGVALKTAMRALMGRPRRGDERTPAERRCDAMGEMSRRLMSAGALPAVGGEKPHVLLVANLETLRLEPGSPMAQLDWGPLVTGRTARRIAEDADLTPVLVDGRSEILYVGRRSRTVSPRVRKALNLRDRRCQAPGCEVAPELCEPHHLVHAADGGHSTLPNLRLYCRVHHHCGQHPENARFRKRSGVQPSAP
jgi:hypothetical protein